jgi:hypothetical protein
MLSTLLSGLGLDGGLERNTKAIKNVFGNQPPVTEYEYALPVSNFTLNVINALDNSENTMFVMPPPKVYWNKTDLQFETFRLHTVELRLYGAMTNVFFLESQVRSIYNEASRRLEEIMGDTILKTYDTYPMYKSNPVYALNVLYAVLSFHSKRATVDPEQDPIHIVVDTIYDASKENTSLKKYVFDDKILGLFNRMFGDYFEEDGDPLDQEDLDMVVGGRSVVVGGRSVVVGGRSGGEDVIADWSALRAELIENMSNETNEYEREVLEHIFVNFPAEDDPTRFRTVKEFNDFIKEIRKTRIINWGELKAALKGASVNTLNRYRRLYYQRLLEALPAENDPNRFKTVGEYIDFAKRINDGIDYEELTSVSVDPYYGTDVNAPADIEMLRNNIQNQRIVEPTKKLFIIMLEAFELIEFDTIQDFINFEDEIYDEVIEDDEGEGEGEDDEDDEISDAHPFGERTMQGLASIPEETTAGITREEWWANEVRERQNQIQLSPELSPENRRELEEVLQAIIDAGPDIVGNDDEQNQFIFHFIKSTEEVPTTNREIFWQSKIDEIRQIIGEWDYEDEDESDIRPIKTLLSELIFKGPDIIGTQSEFDTFTHGREQIAEVARQGYWRTQVDEIRKYIERETDENQLVYQRNVLVDILRIGPDAFRNEEEYEQFMKNLDSQYREEGLVVDGIFIGDDVEDPGGYEIPPVYGDLYPPAYE